MLTRLHQSQVLDQMARRLISPVVAQTGRSDLSLAASWAVRSVFDFESSIPDSKLKNASNNSDSSSGGGSKIVASGESALSAEPMASVAALPNFATFELEQYSNLCAELSERALASIAAQSDEIGSRDLGEGHVWSASDRDVDARAWLVSDVGWLGGANI